MKFIDINRKFTAAVSSYMAQGYYINAASMSGSQGEIAHIDLTDGKQIVRVLLDSFTEWEDYNQLEGLKLVVGIAADNVKPNDNQRCDVIWNNRLDVISCEKFYKLSSNRDDSVFYGTREEATAADEKRFERYCRRDCRIKKHLPEKGFYAGQGIRSPEVRSEACRGEQHPDHQAERRVYRHLQPAQRPAALRRAKQ